MSIKILIIGGVAGGASAAARLRRLDEAAEIIMFERSDHVSFANCGLPYHIGGTIKNRDSLLLQTPESFKKRFNVDVRVKNEVVKIDNREKTVDVTRLPMGRMAADNICGRKRTYAGTQGTAILKVFDLQKLELAYAPPYGSGKDPVNIAGFAAANVLDGTVKIKHFTELEKDDFILDVRTPGEFNRGSVPKAINIPVDQLRGRIDELPDSCKQRSVKVNCIIIFWRI